MRIVVNNTAASSGGALTILKGFYDSIINSEKAKQHQWIFLLGNNYIAETDYVKVVIIEEAKKNWIGRLKFDLYKAKKVVEELEPDVIISLQNTLLMGLNIPQVLYMHQSLPFQKEKNFSFINKQERKLAVYQHIIGRLIKDSVRKADFVIVQTEWIKEAVINSTDIYRKNIVSILPPLEAVLNSDKECTFNKKEFFYPAAASIYKNHKCIYEASDLLKKRGIKDYRISLTIKNEYPHDNFLYLGNIAFEEVLNKYKKSTLVFPSYIETVGLPLIEARELGTIILAANCEYAREVLKNYENAYFFEPTEPKELAHLMEKILNGVIIKKEVKRISYKKENTWNQVIDILLEQGSEKV